MGHQEGRIRADGIDGDHGHVLGVSLPLPLPPRMLADLGSA